ncbi:mitochondrial inner-membrane-bound regulator-domain-containing protein [Boeremia exigua]|uniref:mitochondrial inner-membrane-bound regulator-domain-containing protein n=1 Tax=Boeremia exigua TaxID=749465 RepID=UPI001E8CEF96|nr:mitochondrial inner-membrane-bound regulator-domain-containing protein [Boeremia exigua]KAH6633560.1 mitochondrial inner-membrane-bound regulator-domain-containing protein [Boeremia exigua]
MLAPRASSAFVCLRCELKFARPRTSALPRQSSHASFSSSTRRHDGADEPQQLPPSEPPAEDIAAKRATWITKEYMRKGKIVKHRKAKLGMKRMDEDADVLVLNEAPVREETTEEPEVLEPISVPDFRSSLQQDSTPATQEDVEKQLESLRPARGSRDEPQYVTTAGFVQLVAALTKGFTTQQLSGYYSTTKSIKKNAVYKAVQATVQATKRSEWHPTTTDIKKRLPGVETVTGKKQKPKSIRKATLVDKILRDVWNLELLEELEAPGELELRLKEWQLKLLQVGGNSSALARIARIRNAKVEIHWPTNILRITADKNTAEYTADDVEAALSKSRTKTLSLNTWIGLLDERKISTSSDVLASLSVDLVSSLTSTHIAAASDRTLHIYGLDEASVAEAKRTLVRLLPFKDSAPRTIDTQKLDAAKRESYLLPVFHEPMSLEYKHRNLSLGRWVLPVTRSVEPGEQQLPSDPEQNLHSIVNRTVSLMMPPADDGFAGDESNPRNRQTGYWALEPEFKASAEFGQALFPLQMTSPNKVVEAIKDSSRTPFQPAIPGLGSLLAASDFQNLSRTETPALLYDFLPAPEQTNIKGAIGPDFPKLFIQVRTGRNGNRPSIHKLSLGFKERIHDVLLPDQAADIRFFRYGRLRFSSRSHHDKHVDTWFGAVRQNIESGGRLTAPSIIIEIPKWTIPGFPTDAIGMLPVKYLFSGIQFRQSVTGRLLGTQVSYSTVQSGKLGAKGGVLSAYTVKQNDEDVEAHIRDFATKCVQMVDYITQASAQTQPLRQTVLPRNDHSARKQRRAAEREGQAETLSQAQDYPSEAEQQSAPDDDLALAEDIAVDDAEDVDDLTTLDEEQSDLSHQQDDARLASRLDDDAPPLPEEDPALDDAFDDADEDRRAGIIKAQEEEANALLDDLFGDEPAKEPLDEGSDDGAKESAKL